MGEALFLASDFPIKPEDIIARAKEVLTLGLGTKDEGACLAEGFEFCAAVVGPIGKEAYLAALGDFKLEESFDVNAQYHMFRVDPLQTNRVWFHTRTLATHVADSSSSARPRGRRLSTRRSACTSISRRRPRQGGWVLHSRPQIGQHGRPRRRLRLLLRRRPAAPHPGVPALQAVEALPPAPAHRQAPEQVLQEGRMSSIHVSRAAVVACV